MSLYEYRKSQEVEAQDYPFYALVMAAMRQADSENLYMLAQAFPETFEEFLARHSAPGGLLPDERRVEG